jgi:predicted small lipoprotein YifL
MNLNFRLFFVVLIFCIGLAACGQPGPLYLPKDQPSVYDEPKPVGEPVSLPQTNKTEDGNPASSTQVPAVQPSPK